MVRVQKLALFLPRDAMRYSTAYIPTYRYVCCGYSVVFAVVRCPSVRLSITFVHCIQTAEDIVKHLSQPGSPMILVFFDLKRRYSIPREPIMLGSKIHGVGKICDFRLKSLSISETMQDRPIVAMKR